MLYLLSLGRMMATVERIEELYLLSLGRMMATVERIEELYLLSLGRMMATVERIEEEENGVITVYFSSPYEVFKFIGVKINNKFIFYFLFNLVNILFYD
jgi:hypothetical protein